MPRPKRKNLSSARSVQEIARTEDLRSLPSQLSNISFTSNLSPITVNNNNYVSDSRDDANNKEGYISLENLKLEKHIGVGEFGAVLKGT